MDKTQNFSDKHTQNSRVFKVLHKNQNFHDNETINRSQNSYEYQTTIRNQNSSDDKALNKNQNSYNKKAMYRKVEFSDKQTTYNNHNCPDTQNVNRNQNSHDDEVPDDDHLYHPIRVQCEKCGLKVVPVQKVRPSYKAHLLATTLFLLFCPCSILPYYIDSLQVTELYCPYCNRYLMTV